MKLWIKLRLYRIKLFTHKVMYKMGIVCRGWYGPCFQKGHFIYNLHTQQKDFVCEDCEVNEFEDRLKHNWKDYYA